MIPDHWTTRRLHSQRAQELYTELTGIRFRSEEDVRRDLGLLPQLKIPEGRLDKEEVRANVDMLGLLERYGVQRLRAFGKRVTGLCLFHVEHTPSFSADLEKKVWYCFSEGRGGDCFSLVMEMEKCTFAEAVRTLNRVY